MQLQGHPIYSSKAVRFIFSCGVRPRRFTGAAVNWDDLWEQENLWVRDYETVTETFPIQQKDELQAFTFREPILCVGGCVKVLARAGVFFLSSVQSLTLDICLPCAHPTGSCLKSLAVLASLVLSRQLGCMGGCSCGMVLRWYAYVGCRWSSWAGCRSRSRMTRGTPASTISASAGSLCMASSLQSFTLRTV